MSLYRPALAPEGSGSFRGGAAGRPGGAGRASSVPIYLIHCTWLAFHLSILVSLRAHVFCIEPFLPDLVIHFGEKLPLRVPQSPPASADPIHQLLPRSQHKVGVQTTRSARPGPKGLPAPAFTFCASASSCGHCEQGTCRPP